MWAFVITMCLKGHVSFCHHYVSKGTCELLSSLCVQRAMCAFVITLYPKDHVSFCHHYRMCPKGHVCICHYFVSKGPCELLSSLPYVSKGPCVHLSSLCIQRTMWAFVITLYPKDHVSFCHHYVSKGPCVHLSSLCVGQRRCFVSNFNHLCQFEIQHGCQHW
jgi:hypothetical protein